MTIYEEYDQIKKELRQLTQGTEEFMIKLAELQNKEREILDADRNRENNQ